MYMFKNLFLLGLLIAVALAVFNIAVTAVFAFIGMIIAGVAALFNKIKGV